MNAASQYSALALFDFDGTITTHETMPDFLRRSISGRRQLLGKAFLAPLVIGYKLGLVSGVRVRHVLVRVGYKGGSASALQLAGQQFARDYLPHTLRPEAVERIAWHKAQGHKVVVVSGGLDVYLQPWCEAQGLDLICSSLSEHEGVITGHYHGEQCVLAEKAKRVCERYDLQSFIDIYAYGDTPEDKDLLALANKRYYRWRAIA